MSERAAFKRIFNDSVISTCCRSARLLSIRLLLAITGLTLSIIPATSKIRPGPKFRFEADAGYGFPEAFAIKLKYGNQIQAGLTQSFDTKGLGPSGVELYYHIGKKPRLLDQSPWYIMGGLAGYIFDVKYAKEYKLIFYPRAGRSFHISREAGINFDIGPGFPIGRNSVGGNRISPVVITGSMGLFYRF